MAGAAALLASVLTPTAATAADGDVFISEIHYDNDGTDAGEAIEVQAPVGTDLTDWSLVLYNGSGGAVYDTTALAETVPDSGVVVVDYPVNGIQNGAPDGVALVDASGAVAEFLSYEGTFTAADGPAAGVASTDIGVVEGSSTAVGQSLQQVDGVWTGPLVNSFGALNGDGGGTDPEPSAVVINEFSASTTGTDVEYLEIFGAPSTDYSGLSIVQVEGDGTSSALGTVVSATGVGTTDAEGRWHVDLPTGALQNGTLTLLLVEGAVTDGLVVDADLDGALDAGLALTVLDSVAVDDGDVGDLTYSETALAEGYDGLSFPPGGASRIPDGVDTDTTADWVRNDFDLAGIDGYAGSLVAGEAVNTPGAANTTEIPGGGGTDPGSCFDEATLIGAVQGDGATTPVNGQTVTVEGTVVGDFQHEGSYDGYYVQDAGDGDAATSDGIFVYAPGGTDVSVGDQVRVTGGVSEHEDLTEITASDVQVCATDQEVPDALELTMPLGDLEPLEGMHVTFPEELSILEYYNYGRYGEIVLGYGDETVRQFQPTAVFEPGSAESEALFAYNASHRIMLDDGLSDQNPAFLRHPDGEAFTLDNRFRGGDLVSGATGVLDYRFDEWGIQPTAPATYTAVTERPGVPEVGGTTTVGSFNVLNYFTTLGSRGADTVAELERQEAKIVAAINAMDTDIVGLVEIENNGDVAVGSLVDALNEAAGAGTWAFVHTGVIGTDAITTAFIYQPAEVEVAGDFAVLDESVDDRFNTDKNRPALAQTFADLETGGQVTAVVNHLKSKGSDCDALGDPDLGDGQGNCNLTRLAAADALGDWANGDPTGTGTDQVLIIGDLNSYDKEDPIDALLADGYHDLLLEYGGEYAYSYVFDGQLGYLDYAMASASLGDRVTGAQAWNINADEPSVLDYDMTFKEDPQDALYVADPYRSSDHDPVLVGLDLSQEEPDTTAPELEVVAEPPHIWPANGRMRNVTTAVLATDDSGEEPVVTLVGATADGGGQIEVVDDHKVRVLAVLGATYTLTYEATDAAGNTTTTSVTVEVAKPGKGKGKGQGNGNGNGPV